MATIIKVIAPDLFSPPIVKDKKEGIGAFLSYDWYFDFIKKYIRNRNEIFLVPCAETKPIHTSPMHKSIYQKFAFKFGHGREVLVVSEPVVLIRYSDLRELETVFCYDFPPKLLDKECRDFFVKRLRRLLLNKDIVGCLPRHHASLVNDAIGIGWRNYWSGDLYAMMRKAGSL